MRARSVGDAGSCLGRAAGVQRVAPETLALRTRTGVTLAYPPGCVRPSRPQRGEIARPVDQGEDVHALLVGLIDQAVAAYHQLPNLGIVELRDDDPKVQIGRAHV